MAFAIKARIDDPRAETLSFVAQKTMYDGKHVAQGATIYLFASKTAGGQGLVARGVVIAAEAVPRAPGLARQTPRVTLTVWLTALATRPLGRCELKAFRDWDDWGS